MDIDMDNIGKIKSSLFLYMLGSYLYWVGYKLRRIGNGLVNNSQSDDY